MVLRVLGLGVKGSGFRLLGLEFKGSGFRLLGLGFTGLGFGLSVLGLSNPKSWNENASSLNQRKASQPGCFRFRARHSCRGA